MPNNSPQIVAKLQAKGDYPILDSEFLGLQGHDAKAERVQGTKGIWISSPEDGWELRGPFGQPA